MAEKYTLRNRRSPALRAQDADKQELRSRFAIDSIESAPAVPSAPPQPFGDLTRAQIEGLVKLAGDKLGSQLDSPRAKRRSGTRHLLEHLEKFDGRTWQERWLVSDLDPDKYRGYNLTHGLKSLLCLRVITPSLHAFRGNKFNQYPYAFQEAQADPLLDKFFEGAARSRAIACESEGRRKRATAAGWLGEIEGVDLTLQCLRDKRADALRLTGSPARSTSGCPPSAQPNNRARRIAPSD